MKVSGEIHTTQMTDLFQWIAQHKKSGNVSLTEHTINHIVYFSQGNVAGTKTNVETGVEAETQARKILKEALEWKTGYFEFVDTPLPTDVITNNLQLPISYLFDKGAGEIPAEMRSSIIDRIMTGKFKIPLLPTVATKVMQITRRENYSLNDLSQVILTDQVIAANVLKQANSPLFGGEREVNTLPLAIQRIGSDTVTKLVFALSLQGLRSEQDMFLKKKKLLWEHSSACALFARFIALPIRLDHNLAFLCGLMQDFGKIALLSIIQEALKQEARPSSLSDEAIEEILTTYHPMVGSLIGEKWKLPAQVIAAMAYHHTLSANGEEGQYAAIANLSDTLVTLLKNLTEEEVAALTAEDMEVQVMAAELAEVAANKRLRLNLDQLTTIIARAPECLKSAQEMIST